MNRITKKAAMVLLAIITILVGVTSASAQVARPNKRTAPAPATSASQPATPAVTAPAPTATKADDKPAETVTPPPSLTDLIETQKKAATGLEVISSADRVIRATRDLTAVTNDKVAANNKAIAGLKFWLIILSVMMAIVFIGMVLGFWRIRQILMNRPRVRIDEEMLEAALRRIGETMIDEAVAEGHHRPERPVGGGPLAIMLIAGLTLGMAQSAMAQTPAKTTSTKAVAAKVMSIAPNAVGQDYQTPAKEVMRIGVNRVIEAASVSFTDGDGNVVPAIGFTITKPKGSVIEGAINVGANVPIDIYTVKITDAGGNTISGGELYVISRDMQLLGYYLQQRIDELTRLDLSGRILDQRQFMLAYGPVDGTKRYAAYKAAPSNKAIDDLNAALEARMNERIDALVTAKVNSSTAAMAASLDAVKAAIEADHTTLKALAEATTNINNRTTALEDDMAAIGEVIMKKADKTDAQKLREIVARLRGGGQ